MISLQTMHWILLLLVLQSCLFAQTADPEPVIAGPNYALTSPFSVAPGQLLTVIVKGLGLDPSSDTQILRAPADANLPATLAGLSVVFGQIPISPTAPLLEVHPFWTCPEQNVLFRITCGSLVALTIQIPLEAQSQLPYVSTAPGIAGGQIVIKPSPTGLLASASVLVLSDQIHIITNCDAFMVNVAYAPPNATGLPCPQIIAHADGSLVSATNPAKAGEEIVAYTVGLGQTNPPSVTGQIVTKSAPTLTTFTLDYNYHPNALASRPLPNGPTPIFAGTTPGYVGLYQVNFVVPPVPAGTPPCVDTRSLPAGSNVVQSNLTVSVGGQFSFDGARICVATN